MTPNSSPFQPNARHPGRHPLGFVGIAILTAAITVQAQTPVATILAGGDPAVVAVNPVTNKVYVANGVAANTVTIIDGVTDATTTVGVGASPHVIAVNPATNRIYVGDGGDGNVTVVDGFTNATTTVAIAGNVAQAIAVNSVTNKIYVADPTQGGVIVIDGATNATTRVSTGAGPNAIAVDSVTDKIYVVNFLDGTVTVIDGATDATSTVPVGASPVFAAVNETTNQVYVSNFGSDTVTVIDGATNATATVPTGGDPSSISVNPATDRIYVVNNFDSTVTVIDGATNATATVPIGGSPGIIAANPVTNTVYVSSQADNEVTVIDGFTNSTTAVPTGINPDSVAVNAATNMFYVGNVNDGTVTVVAGSAPMPTQPGRLINISTRAQVGSNGNILIPGFVVGGFGTETLLIRADGPALSAFGVGGVLARPSLSVFDATGAMIASNSGWGNSANPALLASAAASAGAFPLVQGSADSALIVSVPAGAYTVQVSGVNGSTGIALAEVYEVSSSGTRLVNLSTRALVGTAGEIIIPGFVIAGGTSEQLLARGDGPALTQFGISGALAQPSLSVFDNAGDVVVSNAGWGTGANPPEVAKAASSVGAFALAPGSADSALLMDLPPGTYTMQVSGVGNSTGIALAELYEVP